MNTNSHGSASDMYDFDVPQPAGLYVNSSAANGIIAVSGQLPFHEGALLHIGRVGEAVDQAQAEKAAAQCAVNALRVVRSSLGESWKMKARVLRLSVFVACANGNVRIPAIADAASRTLRDALDERGVGARTAIGVSHLPVNAPVEVELTICSDPVERAVAG
ncbi:MAG: RidA family protein [Sulfitobacter sp.]